MQYIPCSVPRSSYAVYDVLYDVLYDGGFSPRIWRFSLAACLKPDMLETKRWDAAKILSVQFLGLSLCRITYRKTTLTLEGVSQELRGDSRKDAIDMYDHIDPELI
ncbi:MAG: hypothetical protein ACE5KV_06205 [Thermoplasmata archaeon]